MPETPKLKPEDLTMYLGDLTDFAPVTRLRLQCLELALEYAMAWNEPRTTAQLVSDAAAFLAFVDG
jgi:hypothetical protein